MRLLRQVLCDIRRIAVSAELSQSADIMFCVRVLSWNMGAAYGRWRDDKALHERSWHWLASVDPDIALVQEVRLPEWAKHHWELVIKPHRWFASAILVRRGGPIRPVVLPADSAVQRMGSYLAVGDLAFCDGSSLLIASVHTPAREVPEDARTDMEVATLTREGTSGPWFNDITFGSFLDLVAGRRFLLGGDWNTARWIDATGRAEPAGQAFFDRADAAGWVDISLDDGGREGRSWFGTNTDRPYQPDHVFADPQTARSVTSIEIEPWPVVHEGLSDHAPLIIECDFTEPGLVEAGVQP